jgi:hypothetical protein
LLAELRVTDAPPCNVATLPIGLSDLDAGCAGRGTAAGCGTSAGGTGAWAIRSRPATSGPAGAPPPQSTMPPKASTVNALRKPDMR